MQHWALLKLANYLNNNKILVVKGKSFVSAHAYYIVKKKDYRQISIQEVQINIIKIRTEVD